MVVPFFNLITRHKWRLNPSKKCLSNLTSSLLWFIRELPLLHHSALNWNRSSTLKPASWMATGIYGQVCSSFYFFNPTSWITTQFLAVVFTYDLFSIICNKQIKFVEWEWIFPFSYYAFNNCTTKQLPITLVTSALITSRW